MGITLLRDLPYCGIHLIAGMTLLRVYSTFVRQLPEYTFCRMNLFSDCRSDQPVPEGEVCALFRS
jgi:hypothetical protein